MSATPQIQPGSRVRLHLAIELDDGTQALSTFGEEPLDYVVGDGTLDPGMELALYGMGPGDSDALTLSAGQAYGMPDPQMVQEMPLSDFPADRQPEQGQIIAFSMPNGEELAGAVQQVGDETATVDFNHPLAGHELQLRIEILAVADPTP